MSVQNDRCREANEQIPEILEGTAPASVFEHIASCDACRDLRFEAERAIATVAASGADFRAPEGYVDALVAAVLEARPDGPERAHSGVSEASPERGSTRGVADDMARASAAATPQRDRIAEAMGTARTELSSGDLPGAAGAEAPRAEPPRAGPNDTVFEGIPASLREERAAASAARSSAPVERFVPVHKTVPLQAVTPVPLSRQDSGPTVAQAVTGKGASNTDPVGSASLAAHRDGDSVIPDLRPAAAGPARPAAGGSDNRTAGAQVIPFHRRPGALAGLSAGLVAAAAAGWMLFASKGDVRPVAVEGPWSGKIAKIARASTDGASGLEVCPSGEKAACTAATAETAFAPGATLRTDAKTRVRVELADGTVVAMDRSSEIQLPAGASRIAKLTRGVVTADVAKVEGAKAASFEVPQGRIEVIGTKIVVTASERRSSVEVARGEVKITSSTGKSADVRAGEEAIMSTNGEVTVANATSLSDSLEWSSDSVEEADAPALRGLGELRAKKPGEQKERDGAVRLAKHSVKTRIVDTIARTEIEEVFTNQTDEELEGIFRFPLPPGAQIERLALEVDGQLMEGAFVDRDRGAAIWRGVIQNAAPKAPRPREEIVWVPGPWRDPALLEWQRGGRFELKIFPIPKKGSRRVVIAYTQVVPQSGGVRRFSYPLAHDPSGSTRVDDFSVDVQVLGHDREFGVQTRGYDLKDAGGGDAAKLTLAETGFVPAGDLTVEYALPNRTSEITTWAYKMDAPIAGLDPKTGKPTASAANVAPGSRAVTEDEKRAEDEARVITDDRSPYVAIALRPKLPRWGEGKDRVHAIVVDASRSMVGERFGRATRLASSIVREMDRRDAFILLACDVTCQALGAEPGRPMGSGPVEPSAAAADDVERFLGTIEPDGGSDLAGAVEAARSAVGNLSGKEMRVIYLGDGTPSVGPTKPAHVEAAVRHALPAGDGSVVAVALGADADTTSLAALARGGGGVVVPYVPGQRVASAALDVLQAAYGVVLRDPVVELPAGLQQVTPARMDPVLGGDETYVFARMTGDRVEGTVRLRGRVGDEAFEQSYPATVVASTSAGNAFVPRLFAAAKIDELERLGGAEVKPTIVALSRKFAVASRHTSLLVLESEAMFTAFGLDRSRVAPSFTGEVLADSHSGDVDGEEQEVAAAAESLDALSEAKGAPAKSAARAMDRGEEWDGSAEAGGLGVSGSGSGRRGPGGGAQPAPTSAPAPAQAEAPKSPPADDWDPFAGKDKKEDSRASRDRRPPPPPSRPAGRPLVPMRRVFDRKASFSPTNVLASEKTAEIALAESASKAAPDSRDKTATLYSLYSAAGRVGEAQELAARWSSRDALDPDALLARADLAARNGDRDRSARILSGLADVRPGDRTAQERLAAFHDAAGEHRLACRHKLALADLVPGEAKPVAEATRCAREQGLSELSGLLRAAAPERIRSEIDRLVVAATPAATPLVGDVRVAATWNGGEDLDISLVDAGGKRFSWAGSPSKIVRVSVQDAASARAETIAISNLASGQYVVEIARARDGANTPVGGEVVFTLPGGEVRRVPFTLTGPRAEVGTVRVFFTSRLVPVDSGWNGGRNASSW